MSDSFEPGKVYTFTNASGRSMPAVYLRELRPTDYWYNSGARHMLQESCHGHCYLYAAASEIRERLPTDDAKEAKEAKERVEEYFRKKALEPRGPNDWWYDR